MPPFLPPPFFLGLGDLKLQPTLRYCEAGEPAALALARWLDLASPVTHETMHSMPYPIHLLPYPCFLGLFSKFGCAGEHWHRVWVGYFSFFFIFIRTTLLAFADAIITIVVTTRRNPGQSTPLRWHQRGGLLGQSPQSQHEPCLNDVLQTNRCARQADAHDPARKQLPSPQQHRPHFGHAGHSQNSHRHFGSHGHS